MSLGAGRTVAIDLVQEMQQAYIDYAMSVITSRALPDVRDGLKPVHRRILYAMHEAGNSADRSFRKSAKTVGEVIGNYHPHGDVSVYDALVRLAQDFSMRYTLVEGHGNYGCFTGDTKVKLVDGTERSFAQLAQLGPDGRFYVYAVDDTGGIVVAEGRNARLTRRNARLVRVILDDGSEIRCTPDHRFMLRDRTYRQAQDLQRGESLMAGYFDEGPVRRSNSTYLRVLQPYGAWSFVHHLADAFNERHGRASSVAGPFVRHHKNFNRYDNRPDNIERLTFSQHNRIHAEHLRVLWADPEFRASQRQGVKRYYASNPAASRRLRERAIQRNQDPRFRMENGRRVAQALARFYAEHPERREALAARQRDLWSQAAYRVRMSAALRGLVKRPLSPEERQRVARLIARKSRDMWSNPAMRSDIVRAIRAAMQDPDLRRHLSANAKRLWADPEYRMKFAPDQFSRMARALWRKPDTVRLHREKIARQWADPTFRSAQADGVRASNRRRLVDDPAMMQDLAAAAAAAAALREKWRDPEHGRRVMRSRIAHYGHSLLERTGDRITPELFEMHREGNIPRFTNAMAYFDGLGDLIEASRLYNHRVAHVEILSVREDVYDITVDGYHNFLLAAGVFVHNSVDGDPPAAMRYTEARLSKIAAEMLRDLDKDTVDFVPNYDEKDHEPVVLPSRLPNLLVNGSSGIAVGMATNIPPHNLREVIDGTVAMIDEPEITSAGLMRYVRGPDFPTAALIMGTEGIRQAYETGRGIVVMRARAHIDELAGGRSAIVVTEIPYQVIKAKLIERIAALVREKRLEGISDLRDETDRTGLRVVIELGRGANPHVVLNRLYKETAMQQSFGVIMLALVHGEPRVLPLRQMILHYLEHQREVLTRRSRFELDRAERRAHILEGLRIALDHIDAVIALIRGSRTVEEARTGLVTTFSLSDVQADAILDMRLQRLTGLEREKIDQELAELAGTIEALRQLLGSDALLMARIREDLLQVRERFGDERRTQIAAEAGELVDEDLIAREDVVVTVTLRGYVKRLPVDTYRSQGRGGRGVTGVTTREEDVVTQLFVAATHDWLLVFTSRGRVLRIKVHEIPEASRTARGVAAINLLQLAPEEKITAVIPVPTGRDDVPGFLFMATRRGIVKRVAIREFDNVRRSGIVALRLEPGDELIGVQLTGEREEIVLATRNGKAIRFPGSEVRPMGREAHGVIGMRIAEADAVVGMGIVAPGADLLVVSERAFGKRTPTEEFPGHHRAGQGVRAMRLDGRTGPLTGVQVVTAGHEVMVVTAQGILIRLPVDGISRQGRNAAGVHLMRLDAGDAVAAVTSIVPREGDDDEPAEAPGAPEASEAPGAPGGPGAPGAPGAPEASEAPEAPGGPGAPGAPGA